MAMSINSLASKEGNSVYYDRKFIRLLEGYMTILRNNGGGNILAIEPHDAYKFEGDFFGLLKNFQIENQYHITVMRVNGIHNPMYVDQELTALVIPSPNDLENIKQLYLTKTKKTVG